LFRTGVRLDSIESKINHLIKGYEDKTLNPQDLEKYFISIKTQLKDIEIYFFMIFSKLRLKRLEIKKEELGLIKSKIDLKVKSGLSFKEALN